MIVTILHIQQLPHNNSNNNNNDSNNNDTNNDDGCHLATIPSMPFIILAILMIYTHPLMYDAHDAHDFNYRCSRRSQRSRCSRRSWFEWCSRSSPYLLCSIFGREHTQKAHRTCYAQYLAGSIHKKLDIYTPDHTANIFRRPTMHGS